MARINNNFDFLPEDQKSPLGRFARMLLKIWQNACFIWNGGISFGDGVHTDNISGVWASVPDTGLANTDFVVTHNLGRIPVGYLTMTASIATDIYTGSVAATKTQITLRSSASHASILLFIV
jgi:hypothetical protein